jgi:hypothetical protein
MLGLIVIGLTIFMIFTLVKNALFAKQLSSDDTFSGSIDLLIPISKDSEFFLEPWMSSLHNLSNSKINIHILLDHQNPLTDVWNELRERLPHVTLHTFENRPLGTRPVPWLLGQMTDKLTSDIVIVGDPELVPTEQAFLSVGKIIQEKNRPVYVIPQTAKISLIGEAIAILNPTLALISVYGFRRLRQNISYPLMSIAQGWMGMPRDVFNRLDFGKSIFTSWKEACSKKWDIEGTKYILTFGEKHLQRYYPESATVHIHKMKSYWDELWNLEDKKGFTLFLVALFVWSFPVLFFFSHPFWAFASFILLAMYRFFSKIVFQESFGSLVLHPVGAMIWVITFFWWVIDGLQARWGLKTKLKR